MPPRNVDGNKNNVFNRKTAYSNVYRIIMGFNDAAKEKNGSDIMIASEGAICALIKLKTLDY